MDCVFCKIAKKERTEDMVYEDDELFAIKDINPKAPVHLLIIPKQHIASVREMGREKGELVSEMIFLAKRLAEEKNLEGYKLLFNVGKDGGQIIEHLHLHLLGGKPAELP